MIQEGKYLFQAGWPVLAKDKLYQVAVSVGGKETNILVPEAQIAPFHKQLGIIVVFDPEKADGEQFISYRFADEESANIWRLFEYCFSVD